LKKKLLIKKGKIHPKKSNKKIRTKLDKKKLNEIKCLGTKLEKETLKNIKSKKNIKKKQGLKLIEIKSKGHN
jgi:hypothetical protein